MAVPPVQEEVGRRRDQGIDQTEHGGHGYAVLTHLLLTEVDPEVEGGGGGVQVVLNLGVQQTARAVVIGEADLKMGIIEKNITEKLGLVD